MAGSSTGVGYARNPTVLMGMAPSGCINSGAFPNGSVSFPTLFPATPVLVSTLDETGDDYGGTWNRLRALSRNRVAFRCDAYSDAVHWFAIEPGNHVISGKKVMAGVVRAAVNGGTVSFPGTFSSPPVILLGIDESTDNSGANYARVVGAPSTTGFQYYLGRPRGTHCTGSPWSRATISMGASAGRRENSNQQWLHRSLHLRLPSSFVDVARVGPHDP